MLGAVGRRGVSETAPLTAGQGRGRYTGAPPAAGTARHVYSDVSALVKQEAKLWSDVFLIILVNRLFILLAVITV